MIPNPYYSNQNQYQFQPQPQTDLIKVRSIDEARNYPIAPGNVITFKVDNQLCICEKALGFSQFEAPTFKVYKLVEENVPEETPTAEYATTKDLVELTEYLEDKIEELKNQIKTPRPARKKKVEEGEEDDE